MKKNILFFIMGAIIFGSIGVYATVYYEASQINYKSTTLDHAIDELYTTQNNTITSLTSDLNTCNNKEFYSRVIVLAGNDAFHLITDMAKNLAHYDYFRVKLQNSGSGATCSVITTNAGGAKYIDISFDRDYSTSYTGATDYRLKMSAVNSWCSFLVTFHN